MIMYVNKDFFCCRKQVKKDSKKEKFGENNGGSKKINEKVKGQGSHQLKTPRKCSWREARYCTTVEATVGKEF